MTTDSSGTPQAGPAKKVAKKAPAAKKAPPTETAATTDDVTKAVKDAAHVVVGFGVLGWNKAQVRRRELMKELAGQRRQVETHLDEVKGFVSSTIRNIDKRMEPVRTDIESRLDKVSERLPAQAQSVVKTVRKVAHDTEHQVRQALGAA